MPRDQHMEGCPGAHELGVEITLYTGHDPLHMADYDQHAPTLVYGSTCVVVLPFAVNAMCEKAESGVAPCQCFSSAVICTISPTVISCSSVSVAIMPLPAVTNST